MKSICNLPLLLSLIVFGVYGQIPIPRREVGFVYGSAKRDAPIHLDFYIDLICPDSQLAFPTMLKIADFYGPEVLVLNTHLFPLPYHRNGFYAAKGAHVINKLTTVNQTYGWINIIYNNINNLTNDATRDISDTGVIDRLAKLASLLGISDTQFKQLIDDDTLEMDTRIEWKYSCSRGVTGTPTFMVNDVLVMADPSWSEADWKQVINPLLNSTAPVRHSKRSLRDCPSGSTACEYLPGKTECCTPGERCIPNVGCRC